MLTACREVRKSKKKICDYLWDKKEMGNPKALKYDLSGYWFREINDEIITVSEVSTMGHYEDK